MEKFFTDNNILDPQKILEAGYLAFPCPEYLSSNEISSLMELLDQDSMDLWIFEFGHVPKLLTNKNSKEVASILFSDSHKNIFLKFSQIQLFIWIPEGEDHFVVFGTEEYVNFIKNRNFFEYLFDEYVDENSFAKNKVEFLKSVRERYTISA